MADNITLNAGSGGSVVAADEVGTNIYYQRVKLTPGGDGSAAYAPTPVSYRSAGTSDDATSVKGSAGVLYSIVVTNTNASAACYLKIYDKATAPAAASDTPIQRYAVPAAGGIAINFTYGLVFANGIGFLLVTGNTDTDGTDVAAGEVMVNLGYV